MRQQEVLNLAHTTRIVVLFLTVLICGVGKGVLHLSTRHLPVSSVAEYIDTSNIPFEGKEFIKNTDRWSPSIIGKAAQVAG